MSQQKKQKTGQENKKHKTILGALFTREEPDKDYIPELKSQWGILSQSERVKFLIGAIVGLVLFFGALYLTYLVIYAIIH